MRWFVLLAACGSTTAPAIANQGGGSSTGLLSARELVALGFTAKRADMGTLLCRGRTCLCMEALECTTCTLAGAVESAQIDGAGASPCNAQTGRMCGMDYVAGGGDGYGLAFYAQGKLIGSFGRGDDGYCETWPTWMMFGDIPDCDEPARDVRSLCPGADPAKPIANPKEVLLLP